MESCWEEEAHREEVIRCGGKEGGHHQSASFYPIGAAAREQGLQLHQIIQRYPHDSATNVPAA